MGCHDQGSILADEFVSFDARLIESLATSNDPKQFLRALERVDCPAELCVTFSFSPVEMVRLRVVGHPNTPRQTIERMATDPATAVRVAACERLR
jgi:hypothetical protein